MKSTPNHGCTVSYFIPFYGSLRLRGRRERGSDDIPPGVLGTSRAPCGARAAGRGLRWAAGPPCSLHVGVPRRRSWSWVRRRVLGRGKRGSLPGGASTNSGDNVQQVHNSFLLWQPAMHIYTGTGQPLSIGAIYIATVRVLQRSRRLPTAVQVHLKIPIYRYIGGLTMRVVVCCRLLARPWCV